MVRSSAIAFKRWALKRLLPRRDHLGRIHMSSASSARSAGNVWITSSSSTSVTCAASCRDIFNIITGPEYISHSTRIVRSLAAYSPLCRRDHRVPGGGWSASSLRTSRRMTSEVRQPTRPLRREGSFAFFNRCAHTQRCPEFSIIPITHRPMNKFQPRSSVAQFQRQIHF